MAPWWCGLTPEAPSVSKEAARYFTDCLGSSTARLGVRLGNWDNFQSDSSCNEIGATSPTKKKLQYCSSQKSSGSPQVSTEKDTQRKNEPLRRLIWSPCKNMCSCLMSRSTARTVYIQRAMCQVMHGIQCRQLVPEEVAQDGRAARIIIFSARDRGEVCPRLVSPFHKKKSPPTSGTRVLCWVQEHHRRSTWHLLPWRKRATEHTVSKLAAVGREPSM